MPTTAIARSVIDAITASVIAANNRLRWGYNGDGADDYFVLASRAINVENEIDIEWMQLNVINGRWRTVVSQNINNSNSGREFSLSVNNTNKLVITIGGSTTVRSEVDCSSAGRYRLSLIGNQGRFYFNGNEVSSFTVSRGLQREPGAITVIGARANGSTTSFLDIFAGILYNIKINGSFYPLSDREQTIHLPSPSGLGLELITSEVLASPVTKGSQWTFLGNGRWRYIGDGTLNELIFINAGSQPTSGYLEFEVESISGGTMTCAVNANGNDSNPLFNTIGVKRYFFTKKGNQDDSSIGNCITFKRASGIVSCVIKGISFRPLGTANPLKMINTTSDRWQEIPQ